MWSIAGIPDNHATLPYADLGSIGGSAVLAELGSATLEWGALSLRGGNTTFAELAERPVRFVWGQHLGKVGRMLLRRPAAP